MESILEQLKEKKEKKIEYSQKGRRYKTLVSRIEHSLSIQGLIWCDFYGNLLIMITKQGRLKIFAYLFSPDTEYIQLLNFKIKNSESISHVLFMPELDIVLVSKNFDNDHIIQKIQLNEEFKVASILEINVEKIDFIKHFYVNKGFDILICQGMKFFVLNQCRELLDNEKK